MPAWTPDMEGLVPFDDEDGINQELPSELAQFLQQFEVSRQFTVEVKLWKNELYAGRPALVGRLEGMVPDYSSVVRLNGPGHYGFDTTWVPKNGKAITKMLKVSLVGSQWDQIYKDAQKEKKKFELEEAKHEAELERVKNGGQPIVGTYKDPATSGREYMKSMLGDMKDLADTFGFGVGGAKNQEMGMPMMMMGMMQMMMKASENSTNLLVTVLTNQNKGNDVGSTIGLFKELMGVRDGLMPKDKHWIEEIVGALADNLPSIAGLFMRGNPEDDPMHQKMNEGLAETRERAQEDPNFAKALVKHMDKKVGPKMTEKILKGFLNIKRPDPPPTATGANGAAPAQKPAPEAGTAPSDDGEGD